MKDVKNVRIQNWRKIKMWVVYVLNVLSRVFFCDNLKIVWKIKVQDKKIKITLNLRIEKVINSL